MNTWIKYILVTVLGVSADPPNRSVAICLPTSGLEFARLIPITAAPYASESHGNKYPEYPNTIVSAISATPISQFNSLGFRYAPVK